VDKRIKKLIETKRSHLPKADPQTMLYMSVLDSSRLEIPDIDGTSASVACNWMHTHLIKYASTYMEGSPEKAKILAIAEKLNKALDLSLVEDALSELDNTPILSFLLPPSMQDWLEKELLSNILTLTPGESFSFHGGYKSSPNKGPGHAVQYSFTAQPDNTFSLTFFNSGAGAHQKQHPKQKSTPLLHDHIWVKIPPTALTKEFMRLLLCPVIKNAPMKMKIIHEQVTSYLDDFSAKLKIDKAGHKPQKRGSCTVKSLTLFLRKELGDSLWHDFKLFYTNRELTYLPAITKQLPANKQTILKEDVQKILAKRQQKATSLKGQTPQIR
jgi:hypothetical protein